MIGDLHKQLESVGRLDVLEAAGIKARQYFDALPPQDLTDEALASQANALRQIGETRFKQGDFADAQSAFHSALEQTLELQKRHSDSNELLFDLSQAQYWVGFAYYYGGNLLEATSYFSLYLKSVEILVEREPSNSDYQMELGYALSNLGTISFDLHKSKEALKAFYRSKRIFEKLHQNSPQDVELSFEIAASDSWIARTYESTYSYEQAERYRRQSSERHAEIYEKSKHMFHRQMEAESLSKLASLNFKMGRVEAASASQRTSANIHRQLAEHDPQHLGWQLRSITNSHRSEWVDYFSSPGNADISTMRIKVIRAVDVASKDPKNSELRVLVAGLILDSMTISLLENEHRWMRELLNEYRSANVFFDGATTEDFYSVSQRFAFAVRESLSHRLAGDYELSQEVAKRALDLTQPQGLENHHLESISLLSLLVDKHDEAKRLERKLYGAGFNSPEYDALVALVSVEAM